MRIINSMRSLNQLKNESLSCAVAIGKFDGIHAGHQLLIKKILEKRKQGMTAAVFTFLPSPEELFLGQHLPAIDTVVEKRQRFDQMGIDLLVEYPLTFETASLSPEDFMEKILYEDLHAGYVVSGADLSFGNQGLGNAEMLEKFAARKGFEYEEVEKVVIDDTVVSSTVIRQAIAEGKMEFAGRLLQRNYEVTGIVEKGAQLGRKINLPTINITPDPQKLLPLKGVYVSRSCIDGTWYYGISNVGSKPTVKENSVVNVETHLFDVDMNLYGKWVKTEFISFVRPERKFDSIEKLAEQMQKDKEYGKQYLFSRKS